MAALLDVCTGVATTVIPSAASKAWQELRYLRKYKSYVHHFQREQGRLSATVKSVEVQIEEAKKRNKTLVDPRVKDWLERANKLLQQDDAKPTECCFGLCANCFSQIERAKELETLTKVQILEMIAEVREFPELVLAVGVPGMESIHMSFESRKEKFEELKKGLENDNIKMIGLQGPGGTGKSTMAIEVGKHVEKSNAFDRVMFISVSTPVDESRIRDDIARHLELQLEEEKLLSHAQQIWSRVANAGKVLIILDDVWEELNLNNIGIQHGVHDKGRCCVLLTTRSLDVCMSMGCQKTLQLDVLPMEDAFNLFLSHAVASGSDCPEDLAKDIVNECGRLPVVIVAVAKTLKGWSVKEWHHALTALRRADEPSRHGIVDENAKKFYNSLKFSYTHLKDKQAQVLFLLCSMFPKAYEIPVELLSRIAIGLGLFGEVDTYQTARSQMHVKKTTLINSSLLSKAGEECVKVHDVIREVALQIANEEVQVIMDSKTNLKENMKYSSWIINSFPNCFDDSKLELLLVWINANGSLGVPNTIFGAMRSLRVLLLHSKIEFTRTPALSLPKSIISLKDIQTLSLINWELGDISMIMGNLQKLESLELTNCSMVELPKKTSEHDALRFLCLIRCSIEKNNPFEVIAKCPKLEELYYVSNDDHMLGMGPNVPPITFLPECQIYHIDGSGFSPFDSSQLDTSIKRSLKPDKLQRIFSKEVMKSLAARAEILELEGDDETIGWNSFIPNIVSIEDGAIKDLIKLSLKKWPKMKCLIDREHLHLKSSRVAILSKLAELQLVEVDMREICCGPYPDDFFKQLEKLELMSCKKLESTLFKGNLELGNLKSIEINDCSMTYLFHPSTAQSLRQLETLKTICCNELKCIVRDDESSVEEKVDDKEPDPRSHYSMFPKLKVLRVELCEELEFILPICFCEDLSLLESLEISRCEKLKYIFGQYPEEGELHQLRKEKTLPSLKVMSIQGVPSYENIYPECYLPQKTAPNTSEGSKAKDKSPSGNVSWGLWHYLWPKSKTTTKDELSTCKATGQLDHIAALQEKYVGNRAHGIFTPPLHPRNLRELKIKSIANLGSSLFTASIASSMLLLEKLVVEYCNGLEHIVIEETDVYSIFPNLRTLEINRCGKLEYVFPASCSINLLRLESMLISGAYELRYVFGNSCDDDNSPPKDQNINIEIHLPALIRLSLVRVPNMVSMCPEKCHVKASSLNNIDLDGCSQLPINAFIDLSIEGHTGQEELSRNKPMGMQLGNLKRLSLQQLDDMETIYDLERLQITSHIVDSNLESMALRALDELRNICVGPKNLHMSFQNLVHLTIVGCNQLKFIVSASISTSFPSLRQLRVEDCEEVERIIENNDDDECCFPSLRLINVEECKRLKCLFSVSTRATLPQLMMLMIGIAPEMEQRTREVAEKTIKRDQPTAQQNKGSIDIMEIAEASEAYEVKDSEETNKPSPFAAPSRIESPQSERGLDLHSKDPQSQPSDHFPSNDTAASSHETAKPTSPEGSKLDEAVRTNQNMNPESSKPLPTASEIIVPSENKDPHDNLVRMEGKGKTITLDEQAVSKPEPDMHLDDSQKNIEASVGETSNKISMATPSTTTETSSPLIPSISTPNKHQIATSSAETKSKSSESDILDIHITESDAQEETKLTPAETTSMPYGSEQLDEDDDLMRLFRIMEDDDDSNVAKAFADLEDSLKIDLNEMASSEESRLHLENALNTLCSLCSDDGLKATIHSLQQEIQDILSSFNQARTAIDTATKLEEREKMMVAERSRRKEAARALVSEIHKMRNSMAEALKSEAELKEQISKLQAELEGKEKEIKEWENKMVSLQERKKKSVSDANKLMKELEAVKKERSQKLEDRIKARLQLENVDSKWSSCVANLKKTSLQFGVHLKHKL